MEYLLHILVFLLSVNQYLSSSDVRSSLTFVIDDTGSMYDDIDEVKRGANAIFDTVMNSNSSQIEDFILVTFNDPGVSLRTVTKDRNAFKNALSSINVDGGGDCPEMAMGGIELALKKSREASFLYVFTDASAKDYEKIGEVEALSQKMRSQVVFVLTGICGYRTDTSYLVYHKLAKATQGQVFHLKKSEVGKILKYVSKTVESRRNVITSKTYPAGYNNTFNVVVDGDTKELVIAVSGSNPSVNVTDSGGMKMPTEDITRLSEVAVVKVLEVKPDVYKVEVGSASETYVVVSGTTTVHFQHGFSVLKPTAITDTVTRPVPGEKSHLSIKLSSEGNVELKSVQILDMNDNVILEKPLILVDKAEQFYTTEPIVPPNHMFKIAIKGYDPESKTDLTRISLTPIQPQDSSPVVVYDKAPAVNIDGGDKINAEYDKPLQLKCKVSGYPKPDITWESNDPTTVLSHAESMVEIPYDFISVLDIKRVNKNATFTCRAVNKISEDTKTIAVETKIKRFFNVTELPKDIAIEYKKQGQVFCKVNALPPATVSWYKGLKPLKSDGNIEISTDNSTLTIRSMEPYVDDSYICEARNNFNRTVTSFRVSITGVEQPKINKTKYFINAMRHSNVDISCNVTKGKPKPNFSWLYAEDFSAELTELNVTADTIHIDDVGVGDAGLYRCIVKNIIGKDYHDIDLSVEYPPSISKSVSPSITVNEGATVTLQCPVDGIPTPDITWRFNGAEIRSKKHIFFGDGSIRFTASLTDTGNYECEARNEHGVIRINTAVDVVVPVVIETPKQSKLEVMVGNSVSLPCMADGFPAPKISWIFHSLDPKIGSKNLMPTDASGSLSLTRIQQRQDGFYTCVASNKGGSKNFTYKVNILAPPYITYSEKQFTAVLDDVLLRIPCNASGNPLPDVTWTKNGFDIPADSTWYDIQKDGTLIIKNIDGVAAGTYVCQATNYLGTDYKAFDVFVKLYPDPGFLKNSISLEEGRSEVVPCSEPKRKTDRIRWFKDGRMISKNELVLTNVTRYDSGVYTCRVSSHTGVQTSSTKVEVGSKPQFVSNDNKNIEFEFGAMALMSCAAKGEPTPEIVWLHDGKRMDITEFSLELEMNTVGDKGRYTCIVSNKFGSVQQEFVVSLHECKLDIRKDFNGNEPLMLTPHSEFIKFEISDGYMHIPKDENIVLACPSGFNAIRERQIMVACENDKQFNYKGRNYSYSDLKCRDKVIPRVIRTGRRCTNGNSEMVNIGFEVVGRFFGVYQVCLDVARKSTLYTKQNIQQSLADAVPEYDIQWFDSDPVDLDSLYDCYNQNNKVTSILKMDFHKTDGCCFVRRQLVSDRDVAPGLPQTATYTQLNVAPNWGTCNSKNWEDLERRIRGLAKSANHELQVWTGTAEDLQLRDVYSTPKNISLDSRGKNYQVPRYLWKVIQDPATKASLAIVHVNVPDLTMKEAGRHRLCRDVCDEVDWMRNKRWRRVDRGYTYCCSLPDFERAFRLPGIFPPHNKLLKSISFVSENAVLHVI